MNKVRLLVYVLSFSLVAHAPRALSQPFDLDSRLRVGKFLAEGRDTIDVMIATREGRYNDFIAFLRSTNIPIKFSSPDLEYVRVSVPIGRIHDVAGSDMIEAINTESDYPPFFYSADREAAQGRGLPKRSLTQLMDDPAAQGDLLDFEAMGLVTLRKSHPHADGRGVTIAFIEGFIDPDTPEMGRALTLDGKSVPKIRAFYEANSYMAAAFPTASSKPDYSGVKLTEAAAGTDRTLHIAGRSTRVPGPGRYWVGTVNEADYGNMLGDFNKDGNPAHKPRTFAIARKEGETCFRTDVNQNDDLTDDTCLDDFNASRLTSRFPSATKGKLGTRFWILATPRPDWIVFATPGGHTHTVASAVGSPAFDPRLSGAAPGAQIISVGALDTGSGSYLEAFIRAAHDPQVDIIFVSSTVTAVKQGGLDIHSVILDRIVERKNKIILAPASNSINRSSAISVISEGRNVLSIGQLHSKKVKMSLFGIEEPDSTGLASSGGPLIDGRIKPDILTPSLLIAAESDSIDQAAKSNKRTCPNLALPPRAICANGTSLASPVAAGGVASLLSILKAEKKGVHALALVDAIRYSARHIPTIPVYLQGHGVFNIPATLDRLRMGGDIRPQIAVDAPVPQELAVVTGKAIQGRGLYEREGWHPGTTGSRTIRLTRTSGPKTGLAFTTRLVGDSMATYTAPGRLVLPLNQTVEVPIGIAPKTYGLHSALLELRLETTDEVVERINLTTIAAVPLAGTLDSPLSFPEKASNWRSAIIYIDVPENTAAFGLEADVVKNAFLLGTAPLDGPMAGIPARLDPPHKPESELLAALPPARQFRRAVLWPSPGVWQLTLAHESPTKQDVISSGRIMAIADQDVEKALANVRKKNASAERASSHRALSVRRISGFYKADSLQNIDPIIPVLVPLEVPPEAPQVEIRATVRGSDNSGNVEEGIAVALFACGESGCKVVDTAVGRGRTGLVNLVSPGSKLYVAILPVKQSQKRPVIDYEIYFPLPNQGGYREISRDMRPGTTIAPTHGKSSPYRPCYVDAVYMDGISKTLAYSASLSDIGSINPERFILRDRDIDILLNSNFKMCQKLY